MTKAKADTVVTLACGLSMKHGRPHEIVGAVGVLPDGEIVRAEVDRSLLGRPRGLVDGEPHRFITCRDHGPVAIPDAAIVEEARKPHGHGAVVVVGTRRVNPAEVVDTNDEVTMRLDLDPLQFRGLPGQTPNV